MGNYRIEVRELNNGDKEYVAQYRKGRGLIDFLFGDGWLGIYLDMHDKPDHSPTICNVYHNSLDAMRLIERHREHFGEVRQKQIARVSYMDVS